MVVDIDTPGRRLRAQSRSGAGQSQGFEQIPPRRGWHICRFYTYPTSRNAIGFSSHFIRAYLVAGKIFSL
jgi:hypothetical protein